MQLDLYCKSQAEEAKRTVDHAADAEDTPYFQLRTGLIKFQNDVTACCELSTLRLDVAFMQRAADTNSRFVLCVSGGESLH
ncbi:MAG: hypothetical protein ACKVT0_20860 [Planctomycetaceae bacterium]